MRGSAIDVFLQFCSTLRMNVGSNDVESQAGTDSWPKTC